MKYLEPIELNDLVQLAEGEAVGEVEDKIKSMAQELMAFRARDEVQQKYIQRSRDIGDRGEQEGVLLDFQRKQTESLEALKTGPKLMLQFDLVEGGSADTLRYRELNARVAHVAEAPLRGTSPTELIDAVTGLAYVALGWAREEALKAAKT